MRREGVLDSLQTTIALELHLVYRDYICLLAARGKRTWRDVFLMEDLRRSLFFPRASFRFSSRDCCCACRKYSKRV